MNKSRDLRLSALLELSQTLGGTRNLRSSLARVLEILEEDLHSVAGEVVLVDPDGPDLRVEAATGASQGARRPAQRAGQGIVGRVIQAGKPIAVPQVSREPLFADRLDELKVVRRGGRELSFLCVPIRADGKSAGAVTLTLPYEKAHDLGRDLELLAIVASMIGQALHLHRLLESEKKSLLDENQKLRQELSQKYNLGNVVGNSRPMQQVFDQVAQAAPAVTTVLIRGESGTGKELIAHAIHYNSPRAGKPFVKVSCAALPESLIESELFGYEPGAFTDARAQKKGRFDLAHGGTLFLDEVGELPQSTQVKLLRVLQEREFERLGGVHAVKVNVRLVAATNKDLETAMKAGTFREDLYYRLAVFEIFLPPLRDRRPDILLLADHFVDTYAARHGKDVKRISTSAIDMLMSYHWPGNVRELENCIERAVLVCDGGVLHAHHLPPSLQTAEVSGTLPSQPMAQAVAGFEKDLIQDSLKISRGNRAKAARLLQTTERILSYKIKGYRIDPERYRV